MIETLTIYFAVAVISSIIFYSIGGIVMNILKLSTDNPYLKLFTNLLTGMILSVMIYSIVITCFNTVMIGLLIPIGFILSIIIKQYRKRERLIETMRISPGIILLCLIILLLISGFNLYFLWDTNNHILVPPEDDKVFYARVADYLNYSRIESSYLDYFNNNRPEPYHYFEIWLTALLGRFTGLNTLLIQQISINSILSLALSFGALTLVNHFKKVTFIDIIICLLFPFFIGIKFPFIPHQLFHRFDYYFFLNAAVYQKYFIINLLVLASSYFFMTKRPDIALIILLPLCFFNFALLVSITVSVVIFCLVIKTENRIRIILASLLSFVFIMLFYKLNLRTDVMLENPPIPSLLKDTLTSYSNTIIAFDINAKNFVQLIITFFPFVIVFIYLWKKGTIDSYSLKTLTFLVLLLFTISSIEWSIFTKKVNSIQLFYNLSVPITSIFFFIISILFIFRLKNLKRYLAYAFLGIWCGYCCIYSSKGLNNTKEESTNNYSPEYLKSVNNQIIKLSNQGGYMGYKNHKNIGYMAYSYKPFLALIKNNINIILIEETKDITPETDSIFLSQQKTFLKVLIFNRYIEKQKANNTFITEEQSRIDFIKENHLNFVIADKNIVIDSLLQKIIDTTFIDPNNGEKFIVLKK